MSENPFADLEKIKSHTLKELCSSLNFAWLTQDDIHEAGQKAKVIGLKRLQEWRERWELEIRGWQEDSINLKELLKSHQELVDRLEAIRTGMTRIIKQIDEQGKPPNVSQIVLYSVVSRLLEILDGGEPPVALGKEG